MLNYKLPVERKNFLVARRPLEIALVEDSVAPLFLVLPPFEDIIEMHSLQTANYSLRDAAEKVWDDIGERFASELVFLEKKKSRFSDSVTYLTRLADLAELAGDRNREVEFLNQAHALSPDAFFKHRIGENLIARQEFNKAEKYFHQLDLGNDVIANLRLAYFRLQSRDLSGASQFVAKAVALEPLDFGARLFEGALNLISGSYEQAIQSFRVAAGERGNSSSLYTNLAVAYIFSKKSEKAFAALRHAVALDPLNENAVALLADLSYAEERNQDAVPSLRCFVEYEQKNPAIWGRLARALLEIDEIGESIAALKRQGSIEDTSAVWNNLGVAYYRKNDRRKAYESFKHAMTKATVGHSRDYFLAARNLSTLLIEDRDIDNLASFTGALIKEDEAGLIRRDRHLSDILVGRILALGARKQFDVMLNLAEEILASKDAAPNLLAWVAGSTIGYYALTENGASKAVSLAERFSKHLDLLGPKDVQRKIALANNIMFAYVEVGDLVRAEKFLPFLSNVIHKEPYPTATLGLFQIRKGHLDRATALYEEAVGLANTKLDKARIRQKLNFELGVFYLDNEPSKAQRYLQKVIGEDDGSPLLVDAGARVLRRLSSPKAK